MPSTGGASMGGSGGTTTAGGTGGMGTTAGGDGGSSSTAGSGGTGGTDGTGALGTPGDSCDTPGALACAGNHQKLTLVCGGDDEWEALGTCGETEFCDSAPGTNAGICREPSADCVERDVDETYCLDGDVQTCGPDGIEPRVVEACVGGCLDGACLDDSCPTGERDVNCDPACGEIDDGCATHGFVIDLPALGDTVVFRTGDYSTAEDPVYQELCGTSFAVYALILPTEGPQTIRATTESPWSVDGDYSNCDPPSGDTCIVVEDQPRTVAVVTTNMDAGPTNVTIEYVDEGATCDE